MTENFVKKDFYKETHGVSSKTITFLSENGELYTFYYSNLRYVNFEPSNHALILGFGFANVAIKGINVDGLYEKIAEEQTIYKVGAWDIHSRKQMESEIGKDKIWITHIEVIFPE